MGNFINGEPQQWHSCNHCKAIWKTQLETKRWSNLFANKNFEILDAVEPLSYAHFYHAPIARQILKCFGMQMIIAATETQSFLNGESFDLLRQFVRIPNGLCKQT